MTNVCGTPASLSSRWMQLLYMVSAWPFPLCGLTRSIMRRGRDDSLAESPAEEGNTANNLWFAHGKTTALFFRVSVFVTVAWNCRHLGSLGNTGHTNGRHLMSE